ncbi:MAG: hypothetical protein HKN29_06585 [Rhodothermales bacterium]|nr:hypothetical protein [Rhodothermales bacterium]
MIDLPRIAALPREARLWLYVSSRALTPDESGRLNEMMDAFVSDWSSHGRPVLGATDFAEGRILGIGALVPAADISGCGIDKSVHRLEELGREMGIEWLAGLSIAFRDTSGAIQVVSRPAFRKLIASGEVDASTPILDLSLMTVAELQDRGIERALGASWHARVFRIPAGLSA